MVCIAKEAKEAAYVIIGQIAGARWEEEGEGEGGKDDHREEGGSEALDTPCVEGDEEIAKGQLRLGWRIRAS